MKNHLIRLAVFLGIAAISFLVAALLISDFTLSLNGFVIGVVVFAVAQTLLSPLILKLTEKYASTFVGGVGLVSTFVSLFIASLIPGGIHLGGLISWVLATLVIWLVGAIGALLMPFILSKIGNKKGASQEASSAK